MNENERCEYDDTLNNYAKILYQLNYI